jgi:protein SCO1/2
VPSRPAPPPTRTHRQRNQRGPGSRLAGVHGAGIHRCETHRRGLASGTGRRLETGDRRAKGGSVIGTTDGTTDGTISGRASGVPALCARPGRALLGAGLGVALALAGVAGCGSSSDVPNSSSIVNLSSASAAPGVRGFDLATPLPKPAVDLTDTAGRPYDLRRATAGRVTLLYFGYTHCPDICPTTMADIAAALTLIPAADRSRIEVVFVTTDPRRDTATVLRRWLNQFSPSFVGLTGPIEEIIRDAAAVGVDVTAPVVKPDGSETVAHGTQVTVFSPDGTARVSYDAGTTVADYAHDLPLILAGQS